MSAQQIFTETLWSFIEHRTSMEPHRICGFHVFSSYPKGNLSHINCIIDGLHKTEEEWTLAYNFDWDVKLRRLFYSVLFKCQYGIASLIGWLPLFGYPSQHFNKLFCMRMDSLFDFLAQYKFYKCINLTRWLQSNDTPAKLNQSQKYITLAWWPLTFSKRK